MKARLDEIEKTKVKRKERGDGKERKGEEGRTESRKEKQLTCCSPPPPGIPQRTERSPACLLCYREHQ